jgi:hypothetical protein
MIGLVLAQGAPIMAVYAACWSGARKEKKKLSGAGRSRFFIVGGGSVLWK